MFSKKGFKKKKGVIHEINHRSSVPKIPTRECYICYYMDFMLEVRLGTCSGCMLGCLLSRDSFMHVMCLEYLESMLVMKDYLINALGWYIDRTKYPYNI